jgi:eukaryotic-like serine/threonine-protein kinase
LLVRLIQAGELEGTPFGVTVLKSIDDCLAPDPASRPSFSELLSRFFPPIPHTNPSFDATMDSSQVNSPSDASHSATLNAEMEIAAAPGLLIAGEQLGRYRIENKLGEGAMGAVYRAVDIVDSTQVAIKVMNRHATQDSITARRFAKEARLLAKANNPYVANLFEVSSEPPTPYMAVELVDGGSLSSLVNGQPLNPHVAVAFITDTVRGLAVAHRRGIVHRDYKPDNILLTRAAVDWIAENQASIRDCDACPSTPVGIIFAKVSDFGLARTDQQSESLAMTRDGALMGTPLYMSPEQCRGEPAMQTSDVYSIGVTLFQLLNGRPPFESDSQVGVINKHCSEPPPSLQQLQPRLPEVLVRIVEKCLAKNPDARYANAEDLLEDLESFLRGTPTSLGLHPPVLSTDDPETLRFEHQWDFISSPAQLWPFVSNTDRVNHAIGLPAVTYTVRQDPVYGTQRFAETKIAGQRIRWLEHPYEWVEGKRLSVLREFTHGPFIWFVNIVELRPATGGGTRIIQTLLVKPRNWLGKQLAKLQLGSKSKANFGHAYQQIDDYITQSNFAKADRDPFVNKTEMTANQLQKLRTRIYTLRGHQLDPRVIDTLSQFLEHASDLDIARIRPIALAERFGLDANQVVDACLLSVKNGVMNLLWDIICPSCRIPANIQETLSAIKDHGYCEACNLNFDVDLMDSVELIFRAHPEIREAETRTYCIGGPAWSKHVVAQVRLAAGERFACELNLNEGNFLVRGPQMPFTIDFRVGYGGDAKRIELSLGKPPLKSIKLYLRLGSQVIHLCNDSGQDQQVRIERVAARHDALTAAKASTLALFRELFPDEVLAGDQIVSVGYISLMRVKIFGCDDLYRSLGDGPAFTHIRKVLERVLGTVKNHYGAVVKIVGEGVLASFAKPVNAVEAALEMVTCSSDIDVKIAAAIHSGTAMVATLEERLDYFGTTLQELERFVERAEPSSIVLSSAVTALTEVQSLMDEQGLELEIATPDVQPFGSIAHKVRVQH